MTALMRRHIKIISWCGVLVLCLSVCVQLLGVSGTLLYFADSEDDFQTSVMVGFTIVSGSVTFLPWLTCGYVSAQNPSITAFLWSKTLFHPPLG
jgi:hypothetical protein